MLIVKAEMSPKRTPQVRPAAVAGSFYPAEAENLRALVGRLLAGAAPRVLMSPLRALVVPHAGYVYSGPIAASAYAALSKVAPLPRRVALLGPSHYFAFNGLALPEAQMLETPLGQVPVDALATSMPEQFAQVVRSERAHAKEHSLEVQLPFLQCILPSGFTVLPLAVGQTRPAQVAEVVEFLWDLPGTLVLLSTDLSHYLKAEEARGVDARTCELVMAADFEMLGSDMACGVYPLAGLLLAAKRRGCSIQLLDVRNSADTAGDASRVVGYAAFAVLESARRSAPSGLKQPVPA